MRTGITPEEVAEHVTADNCWIILFGKVLDVTSFLSQHPGGAQQILKYAGKVGRSVSSGSEQMCVKDATEIWETLHDKSFIAKYLTPDQHIGYLAGCDPDGSTMLDQVHTTFD